MIAKKYRVPKQFITSILKTGDETRTQLFIVRSRENGTHFSRYRVIISKKIDPKAVNRNKLRRQVYEAIRLNIKEENKGRDAILIPKKSIKQRDYQAIEKDIKSLVNGSI